jgi:hypothetical protein
MRAVAFRPSLTATVRGALYLSGRDGETAPVSRTEKHHEVGSAGWTSKGRTFLPTPNSEEAEKIAGENHRLATAPSTRSALMLTSGMKCRGYFGTGPAAIRISSTRSAFVRSRPIYRPRRPVNG